MELVVLTLSILGKKYRLSPRRDARHRVSRIASKNRCRPVETRGIASKTETRGIAFKTEMRGIYRV